MIDQVRGLALDGSVTSLSGSAHSLEVDSICLHGDTPGPLDAGRRIREVLLADDVSLSAFA